MKKKYSCPDAEWIWIEMSSDVLVISDPDSGVSTGGGNGQSNPAEDPFGELGNGSPTP